MQLLPDSLSALLAASSVLPLGIVARADSPPVPLFGTERDEQTDPVTTDLSRTGFLRARPSFAPPYDDEHRGTAVCIRPF